MSEVGKISDKIGYVLLQQHATQWLNVDGYEFETMRQAVAMLKDYQEEDSRSTFAIGRIELVMISRPDKEPTP